MTRPVWREIAVRAWEYRPTWKEHLLLLLTVAGAWLILDAPLWSCAVAYLVTCVVLCGALGWIELANEQAAAEELTETPDDEAS